MRDYLQGHMQSGSGSFAATNDWEDAETYSRTFKELGFNGLFGDDVDLTKIPDQGFNIKYRINFEDDRVNIIRAGRQATPDTSLEYKDNCKGRKKPAVVQNPTDTFDHGFRIDMYLSELHKKDGEIANMRSNNVRVNVTDIQNLTAPGDLPSIFSLYNPLAAVDNVKEMLEAANGLRPDKAEEERKYEFFAIDDTFDGIDMTQYPQLLRTFEKYEVDTPPQLVLLKEIINQQNNTAVTFADLDKYNDHNQTVMGLIGASWLDDQDTRGAFKYGAAYDNLTYEEFDYMAPMEYQTPGDGHEVPNEYSEDSSSPPRYKNQDTGLTGLLYADLEIWDDAREKYRNVRNSDMILGISRNQYNAEIAHEGKAREIFEATRVFYLNPVQYGGSYKRAPVAVKPLKNIGWMGFLDAVFPPMTDCPDTDDDLVDFGSIKKRIDDSYSRIPEDQRLKSPQECAVQLPYNRILERASKAGLESYHFCCNSDLHRNSFCKMHADVYPP